MTRQPYPSDLTDAQWERLAPLIPPALPGGRPRSVNLREVVNAIFYLNRQGCVWRALPHDLPPWGTVSYYYRRWRRDGTWRTIHDALRTQTRRAAGREESPSAAILDSQSVKTTEAGGPRGFDGGKLVKGRKRHLLVDTLGLVLLVVVLAANVQDRDGAKVLVERVQGRVPRLQIIWADGSYTGPLVEWVKQRTGWLLQIVKRSDTQKGFVVLPKRWIVERTFGWLGRYRRLSKDYEAGTPSSEAMIHLAMIQIMLRRRRAA
jgi:putative transposase